MNFNLSLFAAVALIGLLVLQFQWLHKVQNLQKTIYEERLYQILKAIDDDYEEKIEPKYDIARIVDEYNHPMRIKFLQQFQQEIEKRLEREEQAYSYVLLTIRSDEVFYSNDTTTIEETLTFGVRKKLGKGEAKQSFNSDHDFYLYLHQLNQKEATKIWRPIVLMLLFSLLLIATFGYTLHNLNRHKKLSELKNDFINNMSHEFKTPIATIALASKTLQQTPIAKTNPSAVNYLQLIKAESTRLENHVNKVLQMAVVDSGNFEIDKQVVDLHSLLKQVVTSLQLILDEKHSNCRLNLAASNPFILGDKLLLFHLFYNLLDNAIKYSRVAPNIKITTKNSLKSIAITVEDEGIGMDATTQKGVFQRFQQAESKNSGFGLGLKYVYQVAQAHQAILDLKSEVGKGTSIKLIFKQ